MVKYFVFALAVFIAAVLGMVWILRGEIKRWFDLGEEEKPHE